uniref:ATP-dependent DNA helicase n=1 Tax=Steinernema glaseri TaxID=37863 RepID=A0A1I8AIP3_9BILA
MKLTVSTMPLGNPANTGSTVSFCKCVRNGCSHCACGATRTLQCGYAMTASARDVNPSKTRLDSLSYAQAASYLDGQEERIRVRLSLSVPIEGSALLILTEGRMPNSVCAEVRKMADGLLGSDREVEAMSCGTVTAEFAFRRRRQWTMVTKTREFTICRPKTKGWVISLPIYGDDKKALLEQDTKKVDGDRKWIFRVDRAKFLYNRAGQDEKGKVEEALEEDFPWSLRLRHPPPSRSELRSKVKRQPRKKQKPLPRPAVNIRMEVTELLPAGAAGKSPMRCEALEEPEDHHQHRRNSLGLRSKRTPEGHHQQLLLGGGPPSKRSKAPRARSSGLPPTRTPEGHHQQLLHGGGPSSKRSKAPRARSSGLPSTRTPEGHHQQLLLGGGPPSKRSKAARERISKQRSEKPDPMEVDLEDEATTVGTEAMVDESSARIDSSTFYAPDEDYDRQNRYIWSSATVDDITATFAPGVWLSDAAIVRYLMLMLKRRNSVIGSSPTAIIHPTIFNTRIRLPSSQFFNVTYLCRSSFERVIIPLYVPGHWATSILDIRNRELIIYDSLPDYVKQYMHQVAPRLKEVSAVLINQRLNNYTQPDDIHLILAPRDKQTRQPDTHSCGIFAIYNSLRYLDAVPQPLQGQTPIADIRMPQGVDPDSLRGTYLAEIREHLQDEQVNAQIRPALKRRGVRTASAVIPAKIPRPTDNSDSSTEKPATSSTQTASTLSQKAASDDATASKRMRDDDGSTVDQDGPKKKYRSLKNMSADEKAEHRKDQKRKSTVAQRQVRRLAAVRGGKLRPIPQNRTCQRWHANRGCAAISTSHKVQYFNVGGFTRNCPHPHCNAFLLQVEFTKKWGGCCANGKVDLGSVFDILQNPPDIFRQLCDTNFPASKYFLENDRLYNSMFAFGSITTTASKAPPYGKPVCKLNGEITIHLSDLQRDVTNPRQAMAMFGQVYALASQEAENLRLDRLSAYPTITVLLDRTLRMSHPFSAVYRTAFAVYMEGLEEAQHQNRKVPNFRVILLTNRDAQKVDISDPSIHPHRTESPEDPQVAVIWQSDDGQPPAYDGLIMYANAGRRYELTDLSPHTFTACFPMLNPRGIQGYTFHIPFHGGQRNVKHVINLSPDMSELGEDQQLDIHGDDVDLLNVDVGDDLEVTVPRDCVSYRQWLTYLMMMRPAKTDAPYDPKDFHYLWNHRSLAEYYVITSNNILERHEMEFYKKKADNLRTVLPKKLIEAMEKRLQPGQTLGKVFFAPPTWKGSRRYMQKAFADAKSISLACGKGMFFLTFTGNKEWPEIKSALLEGQEHFHRPDVVCRVFKAKLDELLKDLFKRHILGEMKAYYLAIEFQKRGMPHAHIVMIPADDVSTRTPANVDDYIRAEVPQRPADDDHSDQAEQTRRELELIKVQIHVCKKDRCQIAGKDCNKRFPKCYSSVTILHDNDYPQYRRRPPPSETDVINDDTRDLFGDRYEEKITDKKGNFKGYKYTDNRWIVPYNPYLLLKYESHHNLEYIGPNCCEDYLTKYVHKGCDMAYVQLRPDDTGNTVVNYDEIHHTFKVRYMTAQEAMWRLLKYPIIKMSHTVHTIFIHEEDARPVVLEEGKEPDAAKKLIHRKKSKQEAFFELCAAGDPIALNCTLLDIGKTHWFHEKTGKWKRRQNDYRLDKIIVRFGTVVPSSRERYALRLILQHRKGPTSYEDLRTVNGITYDTYVETARQMGLTDSDLIWEKSMDEACAEIKSLYRRRRFFAMLLFHCEPSDAMGLLRKFLPQMIPKMAGDDEAKMQRMLRHLTYFLAEFNKSNSECGIDEPQAYIEADVLAEIAAERGTTGGRLDGAAYTALADSELAQLNSGQRAIYDEILQAVDMLDQGQHPPQRLFFVTGEGGSGKTFLFNALIHRLLSKGICHVTAASTGIAALLLEGGRTAHSTFRIANDVTDSDQSRVDWNSKLADMLRRSSLIIIDEVSMLHRTVFDYINRVLKSIAPRDGTDRDEDFGGKIILISGDFKQLAPVVEEKKAGGNEVVAASIKSMPVFKKFKQLKLTENMRMKPEEIDFCNFVRDVGHGRNMVPNTPYVRMPNGLEVETMQELIDFCYPPEFLQDPLKEYERAAQTNILAPQNETCFAINGILCANMSSPLCTLAEILKRMNGQERTYVSTDRDTSSEEDRHLSAVKTHRGKLNGKLRKERSFGMSTRICRMSS